MLLNLLLSPLFKGAGTFLKQDLYRARYVFATTGSTNHTDIGVIKGRKVGPIARLFLHGLPPPFSTFGWSFAPRQLFTICDSNSVSKKLYI
jgi:hypothetical protein